MTVVRAAEDLRVVRGDARVPPQAVDAEESVLGAMIFAFWIEACSAAASSRAMRAGCAFSETLAPL